MPSNGSPSTINDVRTSSVSGEKKSTRMRKNRGGAGAALMSRGEPMLWLTGGALAISLLMIFGLLTLILVQGAATFWPRPLVQWTLRDGRQLLGQLARIETVSLKSVEDAGAISPAQKSVVEELKSQGDRTASQLLLATGNFDLTQRRSEFLYDFDLAKEEYPEWAVLLERRANGVFIGYPKAFLDGAQRTATTPQGVWEAFDKYHVEALASYNALESLHHYDMGQINSKLDEARLEHARVLHAHTETLRRLAVAEAIAAGKSGAEATAANAAVATAKESMAARDRELQAADDALHAVEQQCKLERDALKPREAELQAEIERYKLVVATASGAELTLTLPEIIRGYPANLLTWEGKLRVYFARWGEFLTASPRESGSAGGVYPAIFGTVLLTLMMTLAVVPFGVLAALYLREYATGGWIVSTVRIAINNLAGVPSIVFGVFGLGFFCYLIGAGVDELFFSTRKLIDHKATFGTPGLLWASLTLALLTLPVVIVATEEALAAVPNSMREGSYACGASKWQTIRRIVLPRAMPGIMTGAILAMARGAGEVAPMMLVGAMKTAESLPIDGVFPYLHLERSFLHLGLHIFDVGFHSPDSEAAKPMIYTTTLLLIGIIAGLNLAAVYLRSRLRRKFVGSQF